MYRVDTHNFKNRQRHKGEDELDNIFSLVFPGFRFRSF